MDQELVKRITNTLLIYHEEIDKSRILFLHSCDDFSEADVVRIIRLKTETQEQISKERKFSGLEFFNLGKPDEVVFLKVRILMALLMDECITEESAIEHLKDQIILCVCKRQSKRQRGKMVWHYHIQRAHVCNEHDLQQLDQILCQFSLEQKLSERYLAMTEYEDRLLDEIDRLEVARIVLQEIGGIEETKEWVDTKLIPTLVEKKSELSGSVNNKVDELKSLQSEIRKKEKEIEDRKESISYLVNLREEKTKRIEEIQLEIRAKEREISEKEEALRQRKEEIKNLEIKTEEEARNLERKTEECCGRFRGIKESYYDVIEKISQDSDDAKRFLIDHMDDVKDYDALDAKLGLSKLVEKYDDDLPYLTVVKRVRDYLWLKGRRYPQKDHIVERFMSAIGSHQIILVAGKPGSGKTTLPECIAEAVGARFERMVVQPNWTDNEDILGYYNHEDKTFIPTVFFDTVKNACENPDEQYFLLLDELNLAHVEYYLSSVLSVMERAEGTKLIEYVEDGEKKSYPLPKNLLIIGTINMDALSKAISPKVIDRSYVIDLDFSREEIDATDELEITDKVEPLHLSSHYYVEMCSDDVTEEMNQIEEIVEKIRLFYEEETKNGLLHGAPICFSPRCRTRSLYMLSHGANVDDILIGKILTQINWELENEHVYKRFMELFDGQDDRLRKKIRDMKDSEENVCFLDYWMTTRR